MFCFLSFTVLAEKRTVDGLQNWVDVDAVSVDDWPDVTDKEILWTRNRRKQGDS